VYVCPPGYVIAKMDYSQGELRIIADQANVSAMLEAYRTGQDLHAVTGASLNNLTLEQLYELPKEAVARIRSGAKAGNFGLIYRISVAGFMEFAANTYGVTLRMEEAENFVDKFFTTYPEIHDYHEMQVNTARQFGQVRNLLGRVRRLPLINSYDGMLRSQQERQAINSPIQGCLSDMMLLLMGEIRKKRPDIWMFGNTHDSLEMYLKSETWQDDVKFVKQEAENLPLSDFGWVPKVPFVVDFEVSATNLAEVEEYKVH